MLGRLLVTQRKFFYTQNSKHGLFHSPFIINEPMKGLPDRDVNQPTHIELHATVSAETNYLMMSGSSKA